MSSLPSRGGCACANIALMRTEHEPSAIRTSLRSRASLIAVGWTDRKIRAAVRSKDIRRVHHGWYIRQSLWEGLFWEQQHLAHVMAVVDDAEVPGPIARLRWGSRRRSYTACPCIASAPPGCTSSAIPIRG